MSDRPIRIAILVSNLFRIHENVRKGTEIFVYTFARELYELNIQPSSGFDIKFFASGNSDLFYPVESIRNKSSIEDELLSKTSHKLIELALFAKAFEQKDQFDLYHIHVSNGEWVLPFSRLTDKPILITMHGGVDEVYDPNLFEPYKDRKNIHFVSISNSQRTRLPDIPYIRTIYHGVDGQNRFTFSEAGGEYMMWAGRGIPEKGFHEVIQLFERTRKPTRVFPIIIDSYLPYLTYHLMDRYERLLDLGSIEYGVNLSRKDLIPLYQQSKLFLFPLRWEEPFGLVMAESLSCGTPIVAYARGSTKEIIKDGITGFLVNPSDEDIRGEFVIKKTGIEGLQEAVEKIYSLSHEDYRQMRKNCRKDAEERFSRERMVKEYLEVYTELTKQALA
jgi:glycosyltransferase involved in cell wall biosynthesis